MDDDTNMVPRGTVKRAIYAILREAQKARVPSPPFNVTKTDASVDGGFSRDEETLEEVLGLVPGKPAPFALAFASRFPLLHAAYERFRMAFPRKKIVRVDTEQSYGAWRDARRTPYLVDLAQRTAALEEAQAHEDEENVVLFGAAVARAAEAAKYGGTRVPLSLHPEDAGKIDCWRDGEEVLCSVRFAAAGAPRVATTGVPFEACVEEAARYADAAGIDPMVIVGALPTIAGILGGSALIGQLCQMTRSLREEPEVRRGTPFVGEATSRGDAALTAAATVLYRSKQGDRDATFEIGRLRGAPGGEALLTEAAKRLACARKEKS